MRLAAAVVLSAGLLCLPALVVDAGAKSKAKPAPAAKKKADNKKADKKSDRKADKKVSKKADKKNDRKADKREVARKGRDRREEPRASKRRADPPRQRTTRRGKNEDESEAVARRPQPKATPRPVAVQTAAPQPSVRAASTNSRSPQPVTVLHGNETGSASYVGDDDDDDTDEAVPAGPRPANRLVADIPTARVIQIQNALIGLGLLAGPANGVYDQPTFAAMAAFQTRNGWTPVGVPTAYSLKALNLPKNSGFGINSPASVLEATAPPDHR